MPHIVDDDADVLIEDLEDASEAEVELPEPESSATTPPASESESDAKADDPEDTESYSKRVQKRINKLTQKVRQFESENQYWREKVEALEAKSHAKEFSDFQAQVEQSETHLKSQIETARAAKRTAIEEGDIDAQIKADETILELREQLAEKKRLANAAKEQATQFQERQQAAPAKQPEAVTDIPDHLPDGTKQWLKANPWFMKGTDAKAAEFARSLDAVLQEEGYSPDDPSMYAELDKRLRVLVPRLAKEISRQIKSPPKARVAGSSADGQRPDSSTKPSRRLTSDDLSKMRRYGFDPNKAEHRKHWLHRNDPL